MRVIRELENEELKMIHDLKKIQDKKKSVHDQLARATTQSKDYNNFKSVIPPAPKTMST